MCSLTCHQHVWPCSLVNDQLRLGTPCRKREGRRKDYERETHQTNHCRDSGFVQLAQVGKEEFARGSHWSVVRCPCARRKRAMPPHTTPSEGNAEGSPPSPSSARQRCARRRDLPRSCARTGWPRARRAGIRGTGVGPWPITHARATHARAAAPRARRRGIGRTGTGPWPTTHARTTRPGAAAPRA